MNVAHLEKLVTQITTLIRANDWERGGRTISVVRRGKAAKGKAAHLVNVIPIDFSDERQTYD